MERTTTDVSVLGNGRIGSTEVNELLCLRECNDRLVAELTQKDRELKRHAAELDSTAEQLRQLIAHSPAVIYRLGIEGDRVTPVFVSDNMERLMGHTNAEAMRYEWFIENIHPEDRDRMLAYIASGWRKDGYSVEFRFRARDGSYRWVLDNNRVLRSDTGAPQEVIGVWTDISDRKHYEESVQRLTRGMESTVEALAGTLELRDAYTAGHQRRVAGLSAAIARDLALSEDEVHAIHLAASVHDLGKIQVPAEILAKPSPLTNLEFEMIKTHSQAGYDLLKHIDFSWPIADLVYQHHERLDGSGYPRGLHAEKILPGAKIIAVADTVEAMYSHRPYRPGFGLDAALAEISKNRDTLYDSLVVDACTKAFAERRFAFS